MIPSFTTLMSTIAGKVAVGLVVASASVGAAAAAGAEVPFVASTDEPELTAPADDDQDPAAGEPAPEEPDEEIEGSEDESEGSDEEGSEDESEASDEEGSEDESEAAAEETEVAAEVAAEDDDGMEEEDGDFTHGDVVSTFVHETELEGCWKGQATAAVARGDIEPGGDGSIDPAAVDEYLTGLDKCGGGYVAEEPASEDLESEEPQPQDVESEFESEVESEDVEPKGKPEGAGKPDHAGQRGAEKSQGKAKGHDK